MFKTAAAAAAGTPLQLLPFSASSTPRASRHGAATPFKNEWVQAAAAALAVPETPKDSQRQQKEGHETLAAGEAEAAAATAAAAFSIPAITSEEKEKEEEEEKDEEGDEEALLAARQAAATASAALAAAEAAAASALSEREGYRITCEALRKEMDRAKTAAASAACRPIDDKRGTKEFRIKVAGVLARRAAKVALQRARRGK